MSHPSWVCGLKRFIIIQSIDVLKSHPSWVCGLKHLPLSAWVFNVSHTLRGCVD